MSATFRLQRLELLAICMQLRCTAALLSTFGQTCYCSAKI